VVRRADFDMGGCGVWPVSAMSRAKRIVETAMVAAAIGLLVTGLLKVLDIVMGEKFELEKAKNRLKEL